MIRFNSLGQRAWRRLCATSRTSCRIGVIGVIAASAIEAQEPLEEQVFRLYNARDWRALDRVVSLAAPSTPNQFTRVQELSGYSFLARGDTASALQAFRRAIAPGGGLPGDTTRIAPRRRAVYDFLRSHSTWITEVSLNRSETRAFIDTVHLTLNYSRQSIGSRRVIVSLCENWEWDRASGAVRCRGSRASVTSDIAVGPPPTIADLRPGTIPSGSYYFVTTIQEGPSTVSSVFRADAELLAPLGLTVQAVSRPQVVRETKVVRGAAAHPVWATLSIGATIWGVAEMISSPRYVWNEWNDRAEFGCQSRQCNRLNTAVWTGISGLVVSVTIPAWSRVGRDKHAVQLNQQRRATFAADSTAAAELERRIREETRLRMTVGRRVLD